MTDLFDKETIAAAAAQIMKELGGGVSSQCGPDEAEPLVRRVRGADVRCGQFPFEVGAPRGSVLSQDILDIEESPRLGAGFMEIRGASFPWTLNYDEVEYVVEGVLCITAGGKRTTAVAGDVIYIRRGSKIEFSSPSRARFLYVTYPAEWREQ